MGGNEDAFQQLKAALDRAIDQILSVIPESDHVDAVRGVVELIEGHTEEEVKYTLWKMCLVLTQISICSRLCNKFYLTECRGWL